MNLIPEEHAPDACPSCSAGFPCRISRGRPAAYWRNYRADPATWGPILLRDAQADADAAPMLAAMAREDGTLAALPPVGPSPGPRRPAGPPAGSDRPGPPYATRDAFLAPTRGDADGRPVPGLASPWLGVGRRKPWDYPVVAAIVHLDQFDMLALVVETLRRQTVRPFIHVVDAGSCAAARGRLDALERSCDDVQVDYLSPRAWEATSVPVAVAMDLIFAACPFGVEHVYATHVDVFLKRPDYVAYLRDRCDAGTPVVGYQMSSRSHLGSEAWKTTPSHTATMYHMPTMRRIGATWSMARAAERLGLDLAEYRRSTGKIDTETNLGLDLVAAGVGMRWLADDGSDPGRPGPGDGPSWLCLGPEPNWPYETPWLVHERSFTAHAVYNAGLADDRRARVAASMAACVEGMRSWWADDPRLPLVNACPDRGCATGCQYAWCRRDARESHVSECLRCDAIAQPL